MIKVASLKEVQISTASPGHLLLWGQQGEKFAIRVQGPEAQPTLGFITLSLEAPPIVRWLRPQAYDPSCVDLGPFELLFAPMLEAIFPGTEHFAVGALIVEPDGPALICFDPNGAEIRVGVPDWRLRTSPIRSSSFYIREWQLRLTSVDDGKFDVVYTQTPKTSAPEA